MKNSLSNSTPSGAGNPDAPCVREILGDEELCNSIKFPWYQSTNLKKRAIMLNLAATKPIRRLFQIDCFVNQLPADSAIDLDADGDCLFWGETDELRSSGYDMVRVHVPMGMNHGDALRALKKILSILERDIRALNEQPYVHEPSEESQRFLAETSDRALTDALQQNKFSHRKPKNAVFKHYESREIDRG